MYFLAIICPPLAVLVSGKPVQAILNIFLSLLFYVPGLVHAVLVVNEYKADKRAGLHIPDKSSLAYRLGQRISMSKSIKKDSFAEMLETNPAVRSLEEIEKLGKLRDQGLITEEEFRAKKKKILGI